MTLEESAVAHIRDITIAEKANEEVPIPYTESPMDIQITPFHAGSVASTLAAYPAAAG